MKLPILIVFASIHTLQANWDWSKIKPEAFHLLLRNAARFSSKIVGGEECKPHEHPYQVALLINSIKFCSGSIIRDDVILTAAHCVVGTTLIEVTAGAHYIEKSEPSQQIIKTHNYIVHEEWDPREAVNDVALVFLPTRLIFNDAVQPIRLHDNFNEYDNGEVVTVSGWGKSSDSSSSNTSPVLRHASDVIISNIKCDDYWNIIQNSHLCLNGLNGKGSCDGDSGGPLVAVDVDGNPVLVGVASFVSDFGCERGAPSVFSRVSYFYPWIKSKLYIL